MPGLLVCIAILSLASSTLADDIRLRNLDVLSDCTVVALDEDGLTLAAERSSGGKVVTWDEVDTLHLADAKLQEQADKLLIEIGEPLFRIVYRLEIGDASGLREPAEKLFPQFKDRRSKSAYRVCQALMWGRIASGERQAALEPYLFAYENLRKRSAKLGDLPGHRRLGLDPATAITTDLDPIWFDPAAAKAAIPNVEAAMKQLAAPVPEGVSLYLASLYLAAGDFDRASLLLDSEYKSDKAKSLREILLASREVLQGKGTSATAKLIARIDPLPKEQQPLAMYWLGRAKAASKDSATRDEGLLQLVQIPALHAEQSPEISAAALAQVAETYAEDAVLTATLQAEIRRKFPGSWHAIQSAAKRAK